MKTKILMSVLIFALGTFANQNDVADQAGKQEAEVVLQGAAVPKRAEADPIAYFAIQDHVLDSGKRIIFMKNPCFGVKGYHLGRFRGFSFENGIVKKFGGDGHMSEVKGIYPSLGHYLRAGNLCQAVNKKMPASNVNIYSSEIWQ